MLPLIRPDLTFDEVSDDLREIIDSGILTSSRYVADFEASLAAAVGVAHAVSTTSATTALHLALASVGVGPGDEVLVSDFSFPASGNVIVQLGATPVLVDSQREAFAFDLDEAASKVTSRTRAVMPVDPFGQPADLAGTRALAEREGLVVVEDAACGLGSERDGVPCGAWPGMTCFSFHPRKVVTTGEGGAVTTDDERLDERLRQLRNHGGESAAVGLRFVDNGFNYRLGEIPAALGLAQLHRLSLILDDRRQTAERYNAALGELDGVEVRRPGPEEKWSYQSYVVMLADDVSRDDVIAALRARGIESTLGTYAMHAQPAFARFGYAPGELPNSWRAQKQSLTLPLIPNMEPSDVDRVVDELDRAIGEHRRA